MEKVDWKDLINRYKGLWIALKSDEKTVVASGKSAKKVYRQAKDKGVKIPILYKVPTISATYIGNIQ